MRATILVKHSVLGLFLTSLLSFASVRAHCDRLDGPVAQAAIDALDSGKFQTIQVWVGSEQEQELRRVFDEAVVVRRESDRARQLADRYFIETAIRLHRDAEGMCYEGVKPAGLPLPPDILAAEGAIESGDLQPLLRLLNDQIGEHVSELFQEASHARKEMDSNVNAGRKWVDSYVRFLVYSHGLYAAIQAGPEHGIRD